MKITSPFKNLFLTLISIILAVVAVELCLRTGLIKTALSKRLMVENSSTPSHKLLILGDSFIYKSGELDQLLLPKLNSLNFQTLNLALEGLGPMEYLTELKAFGLHYKPDMILLGYYVGNDLTNVGYKMNWNQGWRGMLRPFVRGMYLYHLVRDFQNRIAEHSFDFEHFEQIGIDPEVIKLAKKRKLNFYFLSLAETHPDFLIDNLLMEGSSNEQAWLKVKAILKQIKTLSDAINSKLVLVIFPESLQIDPSHREYYQKFGFHVKDELLSSSKPQTLMMESCKELQISCLDLLPFFRLHSEELFQKGDPHFNLNGNQLSATLIAEFLSKEMMNMK
ncbi:MAG: hypothetical protein HYS55_05840 [Candidatus Omnitrophica bacterium]|nr:hypothetical protein [Candidatus Omnitrophota bacterium]